MTDPAPGSSLVPMRGALSDMSDAELEEWLALVRANRRRARELETERARALADELAELAAQHRTPTIGTYQRHGIRVMPRPVDSMAWVIGDPVARVPRVVRELSCLCRETITFRAALGCLAGQLLEREVNESTVRAAFGSVLARGSTA